MADRASSELNLKELRILSALLHERSITRTAELLTTTPPAIILRRLCHRGPQGPPQDFRGTFACRLSRATPYPGDRVGDRSCRARHGAARADRADIAIEYHAAGPELHRRRHCRRRNRRS